MFLFVARKEIHRSEEKKFFFILDNARRTCDMYYKKHIKTHYLL